MKARLIESREIAPNTRHFEFEALDWEGVFRTRTVSFADPADRRERDYARLFHRLGARWVELCLMRQPRPDGHFSPFLFGLQAGDEIDFKGPYGAFICGARSPIPFWWRRAPAFRSMLLGPIARTSGSPLHNDFRRPS